MKNSAAGGPVIIPSAADASLLREKSSSGSD
jgi:hypothetical protein